MSTIQWYMATAWQKAFLEKKYGSYNGDYVVQGFDTSKPAPIIGLDPASAPSVSTIVVAEKKNGEWCVTEKGGPFLENQFKEFCAPKTDGHPQTTIFSQKLMPVWVPGLCIEKDLMSKSYKFTLTHVPQALLTIPEYEIQTAPWSHVMDSIKCWITEAEAKAKTLKDHGEDYPGLVYGMKIPLPWKLKVARAHGVGRCDKCGVPWPRTMWYLLGPEGKCYHFHCWLGPNTMFVDVHRTSLMLTTTFMRWFEEAIKAPDGKGLCLADKNYLASSHVFGCSHKNAPWNQIKMHSKIPTQLP